MDCAEIFRALIALGEDGLISYEQDVNGFQRYRPLDPKSQGCWVLFVLPSAFVYDEEPRHIN